MEKIIVTLTIFITLILSIIGGCNAANYESYEDIQATQDLYGKGFAIARVQ